MFNLIVPDFQAAVDLPGFEQVAEVPLGFTVTGVELDTNKPINREYYFYEYKNFIEYRQDLSNVDPLLTCMRIESFCYKKTLKISRKERANTVLIRWLKCPSRNYLTISHLFIRRWLKQLLKQLK